MTDPVRTYLDTGVLIAAYRGVSPVGERALALLEDTRREFMVSDILELELLPKARYHRNHSEIEFYQAYLDIAVVHINTHPPHVRDAGDLAARHGLAACDALHLVLARIGGADEFITTERAEKPMFRVAWHGPRPVSLMA